MQNIFMSIFFSLQNLLLFLTCIAIAALSGKLITFVVYQHLYNDYIAFKWGWYNIEKEKIELGLLTDRRKKFMQFANLQATILWITLTLLVMLYHVCNK